MAMLKNQKRSQKPCRCGRGTIYTGDYAVYNGKIDGVHVCEICYTDNIINKLCREIVQSRLEEESK